MANSKYPRQITKKIMVEHTTGANALGMETYAKDLKRLGLANAEINKQRDNFAELLTYTTIKVTLTEKGKQYVHGKKEEVAFQGTQLPILAYSGSFGEVTGVMFANEEKTSAVVEYTESYEPTPFASIEVPFSGTNKNLDQTVNKKAYFKMYDDGWRLVRLD